MDKLYGMFFPAKITILLTVILSTTILSSVVYYSEIQYAETQDDETDQPIDTDQPTDTDQPEEPVVVEEEYMMVWETVITEGPEVREVQFVYDPQSNKAMLFSGWDLDDNDLITTWTYDFVDNSWKDMTATMVDPDVHPGARIGYNGAYDPINNQIIIFGGFNVCHGGTVSSCDSWGDTWSYDINANIWTDLEPDNSPPPHTFGQLVYDSES
ncbi:MAG: kelch repeat-containing protein, partial [Candidatus Kariarchaeaceae archaeon]